MSSWVIICNWFILPVIVFPCLLGCVIYNIATNEFLEEYSAVYLFASTFVVYSSLLYTTIRSTRKQLKKESMNKPEDEREESDFESDDESSGVEQLRWGMNARTGITTVLKNVASFCNHHAGYKIIALTGLLCILTYTGFYIWKESTKSELLKDNLLYTLVYLSIPAIILLVSVTFLANIPGAYKVSTTTYDPFDVKVNVPMKLMAGKMVIAYGSADGIKNMTVVGISVFVALVLPLLHAKSRNPETLKIVRLGAILMLLFIFLLFIIREYRRCYKKAKKSLVDTMESNWDNKMKAFQFLFPNERIGDLNRMKSLLDRRSRQRLSPQEQKAIEYIKAPIWRRRRPFETTMRY